MIRSAEVVNLTRRSKEFGIDINGDINVNLNTIIQRKDDVVESIREGAYENVEGNENITFIEDRGIFESAHELRVNDQTLSADRIVINTGARPAEPPINGLDDVEVLDSTDMLFLDEVPDSLVVIGGEYVGTEYAQMYSRFGADVTLFQRGERILPNEEPEVSDVIEGVFIDEGINVHTETPVGSLDSDSDDVVVRADGPDGTVETPVSEVLRAAGRRPNTDGIGLDDAGIDTDEDGFVETNGSFATSAEGVYAIGDVSGFPMFTHSARDDADRLYRHLVNDEEIDTADRIVPWAVFTDPQVGHVGLTEQEARDAGYEVGVGRQEFAEQGKPKALGETAGLVKLVTDTETDELLGGHIVGEQGAEIIHELVMAIELGATAEDVANAMHIHPTLPESINSAAGGVHEPS